MGWLENQKLLFFLCVFASLREPTSPPKVLLLWQISMWGAWIGSLQLTVEIVILRVDVGGRQVQRQ